MAQQGELDSRLDRIAAALRAAEGAVDAARTQAAEQSDAERAAAGAELRAAREKIETLEAEARTRQSDLNEARAQAEAARDDAAQAARAPVADTGALEREIADLRAARAQDLAEMKTLLAELEPMLEADDA